LQPEQPQRRSTPGNLAAGIKKGQEVLVQVVKESFGTKGRGCPAISASLAGIW